MPTQSLSAKAENIRMAQMGNLAMGIPQAVESNETPGCFNVFTAVNTNLGPDDFCWCEEGEILVTHYVCDSENCGCERSHSGIKSLKSTTLMRVEEGKLSSSEIMAMIDDYSKRSGWPFNIAAPAFADTLIDAMQFSAGDIVRPKYDDFDDTWTYTRVQWPCDT